MLWLYIALAAYLLNAISFVVDKYLLSSPIPRPFAYAMGVSLLSASALLLLPAGFFLPEQHRIVLPSGQDFLFSLLSGAAFFTALLFFYRSVRKGDISVSSTWAGLFTVLFSYLFYSIIFGRAPEGLNAWALVLFVAGIFVLGLVGRSFLHFSILAGGLFSLSFLLLKSVLDSMGLVNGIFWTRIGLVLSALLPVLMTGAGRRELSGAFRAAPPKSRLTFILNKILVGAGFLGLYGAMKLAEPSEVITIQALQGLQFVFIFILALILRRRIPELGEITERSVLVKKTVGICLVVAGFLMLILL